MIFKRFLLIMFAAALTAGTSIAATVTLRVAADDQVVVKIDGIAVITYSGVTVSDPLVTFTTLSLTDGWYDISITYRNVAGANGLRVYESFLPAGSNDLGSIIGLPLLRSFSATGTLINGLRGDYFTLQGDPMMSYTFVPGTGYVFGPKIQYGEGPLSYIGGVGFWDEFGSSFTFEERLTGQIYIGSDPNPPLNPTNPDPPAGGNVPEPGGIWLVAAALPLMWFSRSRWIRTRVRQ